MRDHDEFMERVSAHAVDWDIALMKLDNELQVDEMKRAQADAQQRQR